jgi:hypothetical protein
MMIMMMNSHNIASPKVLYEVIKSLKARGMLEMTWEDILKTPHDETCAVTDFHELVSMIPRQEKLGLTKCHYCLK